MSDKEHSEGISEKPPTNAAFAVPVEHELGQRQQQDAHQDETQAIETPDQKIVIETRSDAVQPAETLSTLLNGYPATQQPTEAPQDSSNEFATAFANRSSVSQKDVESSRLENGQFQTEQSHHEVLQHQPLSPSAPAQPQDFTFATPPTLTYSQEEGIATQSTSLEAATSGAVSTESLPEISITSSTAAPGAGTGGVGIGTLLSGSTENIDPIASYSAWRKKKDTETLKGTQAVIESFLKQHSAYDVLPVSYRQIVLDTTLLVKKALSVLMQYNIVSAPLWDSTKHKFAGMLTATDFINLIQFYYSHSSYTAAIREMDLFQISQLRDVEKEIGVPPPELFSLHPLQSLYDACHLLVESRSHRLPLVDVDSETGEEMIVSVLTQYRILKFIAMNYQDEKTLRQPLSELKIGIYTDLAVADLSTPVMSVIDMFVKRRISSVPIIDEGGVVLNVFETVDVMTLVKAGVYRDLDLCVAEALLRRPDDFAGVHTCTLNDSLSSIFGTIRKSQVHRLIVVDSENKLQGIVSLSDIMRYLIGGPRDPVVYRGRDVEDDDTMELTNRSHTTTTSTSSTSTTTAATSVAEQSS
ncbi:AMP-activated serine/threonine-protein kinase regulatory subunit [Podila epicladia]|nr:AMP-activated serine/threonine-protein kinase regulatory subunit [Podila epicladia]KAG0092032.1 AMP-activated serine/threonine-protein kinase regulatory subunit [Podila epicladia]